MALINGLSGLLRSVFHRTQGGHQTFFKKIPEASLKSTKQKKPPLSGWPFYKKSNS